MIEFEDKEQIQNKQKEEVRRKREREIEDVKKVLETSSGRRFLWRILSESRVFASCFNENSQIMAMYEGRRDIGLFVLNEITNANKNGLAKIQNEYYSEKHKNGE